MVIGILMVFLFLGALVAIMYSSKFFIKFLPIENKNLSLSEARDQDSKFEEIAVAVAAIKKSIHK